MANHEPSRKTKRLIALEEWRKNTEEDSRKSQDQFDKALMTLSASGIGVTIAFLDKVIPFSEASPKWLLFFVWFCWGTCLLATVFSFFSSAHGLSHAVGKINEEWKNVRSASDPDDVPATFDVGGKWDKITKILNYGGAILFVLGLVALLSFMWYNMFMATPKPKPAQHEANGGAVMTSRPPQTAPNTKGLTVSVRPPESSPPQKPAK